jgi:hypothetical protein
MVQEIAEHLCRDCGLMGLRHNNGDLVEAYPGYRRQPTPYMRDLQMVPVCLMGIRNFKEDYDQQVAGHREANRDPLVQVVAQQLGERPNAEMDRILAINDVLNEPQRCIEWDKYREGTTPKEHRAMLDRKWMLDREAEWRVADAKSRRTELRIARDAARATKSAARWQAWSVGVAAITLAVSIALSIWRSDGATNNFYAEPTAQTPVASATP